NATTYRQWLDDNAVRWVALPDAKLDYSGRREARLVRGGLQYLKLSWTGPHWRVYEVTSPHSLVTPEGAARIRALPLGAEQVRLLLLFAGAYYLYRIVRGIVDGEVTTAFSHARWIVNLERGLHLFFEPSVQTWTVGKSWLIHTADFTYVNAHFVITTAFLVWLYFWRNDAFYFVRNMFMVAMGLALVLYVVFP